MTLFALNDYQILGLVLLGLAVLAVCVAYVREVWL